MNDIFSAKNSEYHHPTDQSQTEPPPSSPRTDYTLSDSFYQHILLEGQRYEVLSSSTKEETRLGKVPIFALNGKPIEVFEDKEGILVIRNGRAGTTYYLDKGKYTITDHAYILSLKKIYHYKISLKWLMYQYKQYFFEYTSVSASNATWNMTGFFENVKINIPSYEEQIDLVRKYERLEVIQKRLEEVISKIYLTLIVN